MFLLALASTLIGFYVANYCCRQRKPRCRIAPELANEFKDL